MNPLPYLPALVAALAAAACGVLFTLTFTAWMLCDPLARSDAETALLAIIPV